MDYGWILIDWQISIFRQISQVRICNNVQFFNYHGARYLSIKKPPNQAKDLIKMVSVTPEGLWMISYRIVDVRFFVKFHMPDLQKFSVFELSWSTLVIHQKSS